MTCVQMFEDVIWLFPICVKQVGFTYHLNEENENKSVSYLLKNTSEVLSKLPMSTVLMTSLNINLERAFVLLYSFAYEFIVEGSEVEVMIKNSND